MDESSLPLEENLDGCVIIVAASLEVAIVLASCHGRREEKLRFGGGWRLGVLEYTHHFSKREILVTCGLGQPQTS
jgi:hypothetical protein